MRKVLPPGHGRLALQLCAAAAVAALLTGCSTDSTRLSDPFSNPFATASNDTPPPMATSRTRGLGRQPPVVSQALPARSTAVASAPPLRPNLTRSAAAQQVSRDVTGSIDPGPMRSARGSSYGGWTSGGGVPVVVGQSDTADVLSKRYGVPTTALMQTNGMSSPSDLRPGATIVIPVYNAVAASRPAAPVHAAEVEPAPMREAPAPRAVAPRLAKAALLKPRPERIAAAEARRAAAPVRPMQHVAVAPVEAVAPARPARRIEQAQAAAPAPAAPPRVIETRKVETRTAQARAPAEKPSIRKAPIKLAVQAAKPAPVKPAVPPAAKPVAKLEMAAPAPVRTAAAKPPAAPKPVPVKTAAASPPPPEAAPPAPKPTVVAKADPAPVAAPAAPPAAAPAASVADASGNPEFRWPARGRIIQGFKGGNDGINIAVPEGTSVKAAEGGTVAYAGSELKGYGNLVLIRHPNGFVTAYANNGEIDVKRGDQVKRGQVIAKSGQSGNVSSPQLHFELRKGATPVDPTSYLAGL